MPRMPAGVVPRRGSSRQRSRPWRAWALPWSGSSLRSDPPSARNRMKWGPSFTPLSRPPSPTPRRCLSPRIGRTTTGSTFPPTLGEDWRHAASVRSRRSRPIPMRMTGFSAFAAPPMRATATTGVSFRRSFSNPETRPASGAMRADAGRECQTMPHLWLLIGFCLIVMVATCTLS
ncbi:hypothetical protein DF3PA_140066 [Candidatus Defluviicoccus seviourii]|uniref:Uncharacterized protein n=1 Tax=Candidatus Defluviicoccus seviourii TaxID=2565273 RepID=A0A564WB25_9PROT|nr:hypothetical protein DF3PA_140066 [Candidatus Defluviicoccus seviourii]